jgi:hypothetical protein
VTLARDAAIRREVTQTIVKERFLYKSRKKGKGVRLEEKMPVIKREKTQGTCRARARWTSRKGDTI